MKVFVCALGPLCLLSTEFVTAQSGYTIRRLSGPGVARGTEPANRPGLEHGLAFAIAADGRVAGAMFDPNGRLHPVVWNGGVAQELPHEVGFDAIARGFGAGGAVVGSAPGVDAAGGASAWLPDGANGFRQVAYPSGSYSLSGVYAMPAEDFAVGFVDDGVVTLPAMWSGAAATGAHLRVLPLPPGRFSGEALAARANGEVYGYVADFVHTWPVRWIDTDSVPVVELLPSSNGGSVGTGIVRAVTENGYAVGSVVSARTGRLHLVAWVGGEVRDLGGLPGRDCHAAAVNVHRDVVGWATGVVGDRAVLRPAGGAVVDLNALLPVDSGWVLQRAFGIDDNGQIVGLGVRDGFREPFLMRPVALALDGPQPGVPGRDGAFVVRGASAGGLVALFASFRGGEAVLPGCVVSLDLGTPVLFAFDAADATGHAHVTVPLPAALSGTRLLLQAIDLTGCRVSGARVHRF